MRSRRSASTLPSGRVDVRCPALVRGCAGPAHGAALAAHRLRPGSQQHRGLLADLQAHGVTVWARIDQIQPDRSHGRMSLFYQPEAGRARNWPSSRPWSSTPLPGGNCSAPARCSKSSGCRPGLYRYAYRAVPRAYADAVRRHPGLTRDTVGMFLFFLAVVIVRPHFVFLGVVPLDSLLGSILSPPGGEHAIASKSSVR